MTLSCRRSTKGFTMVELSIVIVIIGLIIAGVTAGFGLVKSTRMRAILSSVNQITAGVNSFKTTYDNLPGDMPNAYAYWSSILGCTNVDVNTDVAGCNGDGNGIWNGASWGKESVRAWQHLTLAGLYKGNFNNAVIGNNPLVIGRDVPAASLPLTGFTLEYTNGRHIRLGSQPTGVCVDLNGSSITPAEGYALDIKIDDGIATTGNLRGAVGCDGSWGTTCTLGTAWDLSAGVINTKVCRPFFYF